MMGRGFEHHDIQNALNDQRMIQKDPARYQREMRARSNTRLIVLAVGIVLFLYFFWLK